MIAMVEHKSETIKTKERNKRGKGRGKEETGMSYGV